MCYAERNLSDANIAEIIGKATQDDLVALVHEALSGLAGPTAAYATIGSWAKAEGETEELIAQLEAERDQGVQGGHGGGDALPGGSG